MLKTEMIEGVHVWTASVSDGLRLPACDMLSHAERERADRYRRPEDRDRFVAARAVLRHALSSTTRNTIPEADWHYQTGEHGKPFVGDGLPDIEFNLSHAANCIAVAVSRETSVGVDIECAEPDTVREIIWDSLSDREAAIVSGVPDQYRWSTFLHYWTAKEAHAKAAGLGVFLPFEQIDVDLGPPPRIRNSTLNDASAASDLTIKSIDCGGSSYVLSVAKQPMVP